MPRSALRIDYPTLRLGRRLTDQQLWCMGCDLRTAHFPLKELGWTLHARPDKSRGCARLTGMLPDGGHLSIWGFGFLARDLTHGAMWLERKGFRPRRRDDWDPTVPMFELKELPLFRSPEDEDQSDAILFLLIQLAERLADHEEDCNAILGKEHRARCIQQWKFRCSALAPEDMPQLWRQLGTQLRSLRKQLQPHAPGISVL